MIPFKCKCGEELEADDGEAGHVLMCPKCERTFIVPRPDKVAEAGSFQAASTNALQGSTAPPASVAHPDPNTLDAQPARPTSSKATYSLVLGVCSFCFPILCSIPAIVVGALGLREIRRGNGRLGGNGLAIAGIGCGIASLVSLVVLVGVVRNLRDAAVNTQSRNNLKQIALGLANHLSAFKSFPQQAIYSKEGRPLLSWRVTILPYVEQDILYKRFHLNEPWDSPHNQSLLIMMPSIYGMPGGPGDNELDDSTVYQGFVGKNTFFRASHLEKVTLDDLTDGPSKTIMVVEAAQPVPWTKPEDLMYVPDGPLPKLGGHLAGGFNAALADYTVVRIDPSRVSEQTLRNAITINDGKPLGDDWPLR